MSIFRKLFVQKSAVDPAPEHAVIVRFRYGSTDLEPIFALESELEKAITAAGAGELDGNEIATDGSDGSFYMYGPDADRLLAAVRPVLDAASFMRGARVKLRYGKAQSGAREHELVLGA